MQQKHFHEINIGDTINGKTVTAKDIFVDYELMGQSGCDQDDAKTYYLYFDGATKRTGSDTYAESITGTFYM